MAAYDFSGLYQFGSHSRKAEKKASVPPMAVEGSIVLRQVEKLLQERGLLVDKPQGS